MVWGSLEPCLSYGFFFLIIVVVVEIVDSLSGFFNGLVLFPLGDFFSTLDLQVSLFAPLSAMSIMSVIWNVK